MTDTELYERWEYRTEQILLAVPRTRPECAAAEPYALDEESIRSKAYLADSTPAVPLALFSEVPFVLLAPNNDTRIRADRMLREADITPEIALEVQQQATAYMIAATGMGAVFISDMAVEKLPAHGALAYYKPGSEAARRSVCFTMKKHKQKTRGNGKKG